MKISNPYAGITRIRLEGMISAFSPCHDREGTPLFFGGKNMNYFNMSSEKKDSLREWSSYYSYKAAVKTGS